MGKIKKLKSNELVGGVDREDVYPITSTKAVFDDSNTSQDDINKNRLERIEDLEETMPTTVKSITINGGQRINTVDKDGNVDLTIYSDGGQDYEGLTEVVADLRDIVGENPEEPQSGTLLERVDTLEEAVGTGGSVDQRIEDAINNLDSQIVVNYGEVNPHIRGAVQLADGKLTRFELEENDIASASDLQALDEYTRSIYQTKIEAVSTRPATGEAGIIYRVPNSGGTTYTDWMYSDGWKELATFNIATLNASDVNYDNSQSGLAATDVQGAVDEQEVEISELASKFYKEIVLYHGSDLTTYAKVATYINCTKNGDTLTFYNQKKVSYTTAIAGVVVPTGIIGKKVVFHFDYTKTSSDTSSPSFSFFNSSSTVLGSVCVINKSSGTVDVEVTIPASTKWLGFHSNTMKTGTTIEIIDLQIIDRQSRLDEIDSALTAVGTSYDKTTSGLTSSNVQGAVDEVAVRVGNLEPEIFRTPATIITNYGKNRVWKNGSIVNTADFYCVKYDVSSITDIVITTSLVAANTGYYTVIFVDAGETVLQSLYPNNSDVTIKLNGKLIEVPSGAAAVYVNGRYQSPSAQIESGINEKISDLTNGLTSRLTKCETSITSLETEIFDVNENGLFFVDKYLNIGAKIDATGFHAININE